MFLMTSESSAKAGVKMACIYFINKVYNLFIEKIKLVVDIPLAK